MLYIFVLFLPIPSYVRRALANAMVIETLQYYYSTTAHSGIYIRPKDRYIFDSHPMIYFTFTPDRVIVIQ